MTEQRDTYETTKARLEEISAAARAKDVTLEKSIELLEEAVRLANLCTEHVDQVETFVAAPESEQAPQDPGTVETEGIVALDAGSAEVVVGRADAVPAHGELTADSADDVVPADHDREPLQDADDATERAATDPEQDFGDPLFDD